MRRHTVAGRMPAALVALGCGVLTAACASKAAPTAATSPPAAPPAASAAPAPVPTTLPTPLPTTTPGTRPAECVRAQLAVVVGPPFGAATGTAYGDVVLTNVSHAACWVRGSASVVALDAQRQIVPVRLTGPVTPASPVVLPPGSSASEVLGYGSDGDPEPGRATCGPEEDYFEVTLPGVAEGVEVPGWHREKCESDDIVTTNLVPGASARP